MNRVGNAEIFLIFIILPMILILPTLLQIFLSTRENKYLGWILPIGFGLIGSIIFLNIAVFQSITGMERVRIVLTSVIFSYTPAALMTLVYKLSRKKYRSKTEIEKMSIKDL
ncbi:MAG: hypothetical protein GXY89_06690 [Tissierellia bacterium]|jgi:uncharacterized membrane protein HdeD (DUF308 family)|nr:hypothetical protein [Tissierellia bacterium]